MNDRGPIKFETGKKSGGHIYAYKIIDFPAYKDSGRPWIKVGCTRNHCRTRMEDYCVRHDLNPETESLRQVYIGPEFNLEWVENVIHIRLLKMGCDKGGFRAGEVFCLPEGLGYNDALSFITTELERLMDTNIQFVIPAPRTQSELDWRDRELSEEWGKIREQREQRREREQSRHRDEQYRMLREQIKNILDRESRVGLGLSELEKRVDEVLSGKRKLAQDHENLTGRAVGLRYEIRFANLERQDKEMQKRELDHEKEERTKVPCSNCGVKIPPAIARRNFGVCDACVPF